MRTERGPAAHCARWGQPLWRQAPRWWWGCVLLAAAVQVYLYWRTLQTGNWGMPDSFQYLRLARNWVEHGVWSQQAHPPWTPDLQRTPGYPQFLAALGFSVPVVLAVQNGLALLNAWWVALLTRQLVGWSGGAAQPPQGSGRWYIRLRRGAPWLASALYLFSSYRLLFANLVLTETLFLALALPAGVLLLQYGRRASGRCFGAAVLLMLLATLVKNAGLVLLLTASLAPLAHLLRTRRPGRLLPLLWLLLPALVLGAWMARNHALSGRWVLSTLGDVALLHGKLGGALALQQNTSTNEATLVRLADSVLVATLHPKPVYCCLWGQCSQETEVASPEAVAAARQWLLRHPSASLRLTAHGLWGQFRGVGYRTARWQTGLAPLALGMAACQAMLNALVLAALLAAIGRLGRGPRPLSLLVLALLAWLLLHAAVWGEGRYRMVADPFLLALGAAYSSILLFRLDIRTG